MFGLTMDLVEMLNQLVLNTLMFQLIVSESFYMNLHVELKIPRNGLINIKIKDQKCLYGVMLEILDIRYYSVLVVKMC